MTGNPSASRLAAGWLTCLCLCGPLFLAACGDLPAAGTAVPSAPVPLRTRGEGIASAPCGPLWPTDGAITLRGLYRTSGSQSYLDVSRIVTGTAPCWARFFLDRDLGLGTVAWDAPAYIEVSGWVSSERWSSAGLWDLRVTGWVELGWGDAAAWSACGQAVSAHATALQGLDWSGLATPAYVTGTAGYRPALEDLDDLPWLPIGADDGRPLLLLEAHGPDLPPVRPLVSRWISLECVYDLEAGRVLELVATIRGEVQE